MTIQIELRRAFTVGGVEPADLEIEAGRLMEKLQDLEKSGCIRDPAVALDLGKALIEIEVVGEGDTFEDAVATADSSIRTAIHAGGGATPAWQNIRTESQHAQLVGA